MEGRHSNQKHVLVVGAVNVDRFYCVPSLQPYRTLSWWPTAGEVALSDEHREELERLLSSSPDIVPTHTCGGGQAGNFALTLARCKVRATLLASIGKDAAASLALRELEHVDLSLALRKGRTAEAFIFVDASGERDILLHAPRQQAPPLVESAASLHVDHAHFTSFPLEEQLEVQADIAARLPGSPPLSLDIGSLYAAMGHQRLAGLLRRLDVLFATKQELQLFTRLPLPAALDPLFAAGVTMICCKSGPAGASLYARDGSIVASDAPQVNVVDTTGAGDVFAGIFVAARLNGAPPPTALHVATRLAAKSVTAWGRAAYPSNSDFQAALEAAAVGKLAARATS